MTKKKVLLLFAHPSHHKSEVNVPLFQAANQVPGVTTVDLYFEYPRFNIDINREQQRLLDHDIIIFQFPLYWYSTPSLLKEWQDLVLEYGFAYGEGGNKLHGKTFLCSITAGGKEEAYCAKGNNHFTLADFLQPIEQMVSLTGMTYIAPLVLFGSRTAVEEQRVQVHAERYQRLLEALISDQVDLNAARQRKKITTDLSPIMKESTQ
ncbi:NAD(P)H-dependent oxidoreductase [Vibrio profundum]|uniref:NAD(P)H-dependent oxidoreductase n=1 Tax=Vibrio profundum TaxID=2910247 RepID=UPI003D0CA5E2